MSWFELAAHAQPGARLAGELVARVELSSEVDDPHTILLALGVAAPAEVAPVGGGWDTSIWRVRDGGHVYALRVFRAEQAETCQREALVMQTLFDAGLPIPRVQAQGSSHGRPALLMDWCRGRTLLQELRARPWQAWRLAQAMGRTLAMIHASPVPPWSAQVLRNWNPGVQDLDPTIRARLQAAAMTQRSLLHLDYHPLNVMTDGRAISGVLDWANVAIGDRRADLARTVSLFRLGPTPPDARLPVERLARRVLEAGWRSGYRQLQTSDPFVDMAPFYTWAGAMMERDLRPKLGRPGVWLRESDLSRIQRWTAAWQARAG